ncbi:hypothetical protein JCM10213_005406 [Rhodosporidiobolus nylandii]
MPTTPRTPAASSTSSTSPATLDAFLNPSSSSTKRSATAVKGSAAKKQRVGTPGKGKHKAKGTKPLPRPRRSNKPLEEDNRNLGTLELLDSSDDEQQPVASTSKAATGSAGGRRGEKAARSGSGGGENGAAGKGRDKMHLEEEDWMQDVEPVSSPVSPPAEARSASPPAVAAGKADRKGKAKAQEAEIVLEDTDDDEVEILQGGGVEKCECGEVLQGMGEKARTAHLSTCASSPFSAAPSASSKPSLLAPLSRLFSRAPPSPVSSNSTSAAPASAPAPAATPVTPGSAVKGMKGVLSALPNAFTALMQGHNETAQWKAAEESEKKKGRLPQGEKRGVPFYKWIDGMEITVDAFRYGKIEGCKAYFLSHAHSDHYQNLSASWSGGPIYASQTTINLIKLKLKVKDEYLFPLPLDQTVKVHGIDVTLIDANHCPGSVLFLFEGPHTDPKSPYSRTPDKIFRYLHCGDFRASPQHILHPAMSFPPKNPSSSASSAPMQPTRSFLSGPLSTSSFDPLSGRVQKPLNAIYLDTTYLSPSYCFPAQDLVVSACAELVRERVETGEEGVMWRADGREGERKGMQGWLGKGGVKDEVKDEEGDGMVEMTPLPEEEELDGDGDGGDGGEESQPRVPELPLPGEDEEEDEEAWLAAHSQGFDMGGDEASVQAEQEAEGDSLPLPLPLEEEECEPHPPMDGVLEEVKEEGAGQGEDAKPALSALEDGAEEVKPDLAAVKEEEGEDVKPCLSPGEKSGLKQETGEDLKPDLKPDLEPDVKPKKKEERLLVLVGTYSIGKERIVKAIASALQTKVYADERKTPLFLAQDDPELHALLTDDPLRAQVHVGGLRDITRDAMQEYLGKLHAKRVEGGFTSMIGLRPTGWTYRSESKDKYPSIAKILQLEQQRKFSPAGLYPQRDSTPQTMAFGVPYSEHSSFFELTCFCLSLDYVKVIPTVNVHNAQSRSKMKGWIDRWAAEKKRRKDARLPKVVPFRSERYW